MVPAARTRSGTWTLCVSLRFGGSMLGAAAVMMMSLVLDVAINNLTPKQDSATECPLLLVWLLLVFFPSN